MFPLLMPVTVYYTYSSLFFMICLNFYNKKSYVKMCQLFNVNRSFLSMVWSYKDWQHLGIVKNVKDVSQCYKWFLYSSGGSVDRAFASWAWGRGFDPRPRRTKDVIKMVPDAFLLRAQHIRIHVGLASLSSQTLFKIRDGFHPEWAVESNW